MMDEQVAVSQLTNFFSLAEGMSGLRSGFGWQLERSELQLGMNRSAPRTDDAMVRCVDAETEARYVHGRLCRLTASEQNILEAAYGDPSRIGNSDVSVSLACGTQTAIKNHHQCVEAASARLAARLGTTGKDSHDKETVERTRIGYINWLAEGRGDNRQELLGLIIAEARRIRQSALEAYCAADEKAEAA